MEVLVYQNLCVGCTLSKCWRRNLKIMLRVGENSQDLLILQSIVDEKQEEKKAGLTYWSSNNILDKIITQLYFIILLMLIFCLKFCLISIRKLQTFRWKKVYSQHELSTFSTQTIGVLILVIHDIRPIKRGKSGRLEIIEIVGNNQNYAIEKIRNS